MHDAWGIVEVWVLLVLPNVSQLESYSKYEDYLALSIVCWRKGFRKPGDQSSHRILLNLRIIPTTKAVSKHSLNYGVLTSGIATSSDSHWGVGISEETQEFQFWRRWTSTLQEKVLTPWNLHIRSDLSEVSRKSTLPHSWRTNLWKSSRDINRDRWGFPLRNSGEGGHLVTACFRAFGRWSL